MGQRNADDADAYSVVAVSDDDEVMGDVVDEQDYVGDGTVERPPCRGWAVLCDFDAILHCARWMSSKICDQETNNVGLSAEQRGEFGHAAHIDAELEKALRCFAMYMGCANPSPRTFATIRAVIARKMFPGIYHVGRRCMVSPKSDGAAIL